MEKGTYRATFIHINGLHYIAGIHSYFYFVDVSFV